MDLFFFRDPYGLPFPYGKIMGMGSHQPKGSPKKSHGISPQRGKSWEIPQVDVLQCWLWCQLRFFSARDHRWMEKT